MQGRRFHEAYPGTAWLLLFILAFFALELVGHRKLTGEFPGFGLLGVSGKVTYVLGSVDYLSVERGEYWRILTAAFLHGGFLHILFNGWVLFDIGRLCEPLLSSWKFIVTYTCCAAGGSIGSLAYHYSVGRAVGSVGASGALCGLIGLLLVYSIKERQTELRDGLLRWIVMIAILSYFMGGRIDHAGHAGGFVVGSLLGFTVKDYISSQKAARWRYPGYAALALLMLCLGIGLKNYFTTQP